MPFNVAVRHGQDYLLVVCTGPGGLADHLAAADQIAREAGSGDYGRVLLDLRRVEPHLAYFEHLQLGAYIAKAFSGLRVTIVVAPQTRAERPNMLHKSRA